MYSCQEKLEPMRVSQSHDRSSECINIYVASLAPQYCASHACLWAIDTRGHCRSLSGVDLLHRS